MDTDSINVVFCLSVIILWTIHSTRCEPIAILKHQSALNAAYKKFSKLDSKLLKANTWTRNDCQRVRTTVNKNGMVINKLQTAIRRYELNPSLKSAEKMYHIGLFQVLVKELNETQQFMFQSFAWLDRNYKDALNLVASSKQRLDTLREATLHEEKEYASLLKAEKDWEALNSKEVSSVVGDILKDVADAANKLEKDLDGHAFEEAAKKESKGDNIETVIKVKEKSEDNDTKSNDNADEGVIKLVDTKNNQYVLSKGRDSTVPLEDKHLIMDIILLILVCSACGWLCTAFTLPAMFGHIVGGVILGPSGFNILKLETIGGVGVFFILFSVGLELSPDKLKKVFRTSCVAASAMMLLMVSVGVLCGRLLLDATTAESAFVASCLALSSTPLVVKFLQGSPSTDSTQGLPGVDYGSVLLGILVMQDVLLGLIIAVLPILAKSAKSSKNEAMTKLYVHLLARICGALIIVLIVATACAKFVMGRVYTYIVNTKNKELLILSAVAVMFLMMLLTDLLEISMELGCFIAGVMISSQGEDVGEKMENSLLSLKEFFSILFFSSIGLHIFPTFLAYETTILITLTIAVVSTKFVIGLLVLYPLLPLGLRGARWVMSAGLAQVSEFSFVLSSRARHLGLVSREVYLLILSVTTLSLVFAPVLWKVSLWRTRRAK